MGGYEDNDSILDQIWSSLVQSDSANVVEQAATEKEPVPPVHVDYPNSSDQEERADKHIGDEVSKRLKMEHKKVVQDKEIMHNNWSNFPDTTTVLAPSHKQTI